MRSIDPQAARWQGEPSGVVHTVSKLDWNTPIMRSTTWDKITAADLSRLELSAHVRYVLQKRARGELGTGIHSYIIGADAQAIGTTPGRPVGLG